MTTENKLLNLIADLTEMLSEYGVDEKEIKSLYKRYGVAKIQITPFTYNLVVLKKVGK